MNANYFDPRDLISNVGLLDTLMLIQNTNSTHEEAKKSMLLHYVEKMLANALNSLMFAEDRSS